jgi:hypothetical protein
MLRHVFRKVNCYCSTGGTRQATLHYFRCSGRVNCYCFTGGTCQATLHNFMSSGRVIYYYSTGGTRQATLHYFMCSGRVNCYCSTGGTRQAILHSFMSSGRVNLLLYWWHSSVYSTLLHVLRKGKLTAPLVAPVRLLYIPSCPP